MDYDGYERRPPQVPKPLSREDEQRITAEREYAEQQRQEREERHLAFLRSSPAFSVLVAAHDIYSEHNKGAIAAAAAKEMAERFTSHNIDVKQLAEVVRDTIAKFDRQHDQQPLHQPDAATRQAQQSVEPDVPTKPGPTGQSLGKYAELERLLDPGCRDDSGEQVTRQQREESDRRQQVLVDDGARQREEIAFGRTLDVAPKEIESDDRRSNEPLLENEPDPDGPKREGHESSARDTGRGGRDR